MPESTGGTEKKKFNPTWLVENEQELNDLKSNLGKVGRRLWLIHETGIGALSTDQLRDELLSLSKASVKEGVEEEAIGYLARINKHIQEQDEFEEVGSREKTEGDEQRFSQLIQEFIGRLESSQLQQQAQLPFTPEAFARAMGQANPEEQLELYLMAEETMFPMPMQLQVPSFLLSSDPIERKRQQKEWKARAQLATMAANKKMCPSYDKQFPNQEAIDFTREHLVDLLNMEGVVEMASLYTYIISEDTDLSFLKATNPDYDSSNEDNEDNENSSQFIKSFFEIGTGAQFISVHTAMKEYISQRYNLSPDKVRNADNVAWNLVYSANVVEEFDSVYENDREKRIPPTVYQLKSLSMWMMMHPQERLTSKVQDPDPSKKEKGEIWIPEAMGSLGEWAVNRAEKLNKKLDVVVFPKTMFRNVFRTIKPGIINADKLKAVEEWEKKLVEKGKLTKRGSKEKLNLFHILKYNGQMIFEGKSEIVKPQDLSWAGVETPFSGYQFNTLSPAIKVFNVVAKGEADNLKELADATRKLKFEEDDRYYREVLLMAVNGVNPTKLKLTPAMGRLDWVIYLHLLKQSFPNFFK